MYILHFHYCIWILRQRTRVSQDKKIYNATTRNVILFQSPLTQTPGKIKQLVKQHLDNFLIKDCYLWLCSNSICSSDTSINSEITFFIKSTFVYFVTGKLKVPLVFETTVIVISPQKLLPTAASIWRFLVLVLEDVDKVEEVTTWWPTSSMQDIIFTDFWKLSLSGFKFYKLERNIFIILCKMHISRVILFNILKNVPIMCDI